MSSKHQEIFRIRNIYSGRDAIGKKSLYAWYRPEVRQQDAESKRVLSNLLFKTIGTDLSKIHVLDVGCGTGHFLRTLIEWGANPAHLTGTEFLTDRLDIARNRSSADKQWHLGELDFAASENFDLVITNTVFSSVLASSERVVLAKEMWRVLKPGGWILVFDFRYNNPANKNVRKVTRDELRRFWVDNDEEHYQSLLLAPPISRRLIPLSRLLAETLSMCLPFLRSHFYFMAKKPL